MITELPKHEFYKCKRLLHKQSLQESLAIINGMNPGRIFVDDQNNPASAIVWLGNNDGFIFIGDSNNQPFLNELTSFIDNVIIPEARNVQLDSFEAISDHPGWYRTIEEMFGHRQLESWNQRVYKITLDHFRKDVKLKLPDGYHLLPLTPGDWDHYVKTSILEFWPTLDHFFANGIGYVITHNEQTVSICLSSFVAEDVHCIAIETKKAHQGKKLAQTVAYHYVQHCLSHQLIPYWDCMEENKPSVAIAEKLGFQLSLPYKGYFFSLS